MYLGQVALSWSSAFIKAPKDKLCFLKQKQFLLTESKLYLKGHNKTQLKVLLSSIYNYIKHITQLS